MTFTCWGIEFDPFDHPYNTTIRNERAVEIPVAVDWMADRVLADGVEVGNVLAHYGFPAHRVVDLYEPGDAVENIDVFDLDGSFDWIVTISTLEHVGETDPLDSVLAVEHLRSLLAPGGEMLVTIPGGCNPLLDDYLAVADTVRACTLVRAGGGWVQTARPTFLPYGSSTSWAESVWIGEFRNEVH